jgi:hypothetical protein
MSVNQHKGKNLSLCIDEEITFHQKTNHLSIICHFPCGLEATIFLAVVPYQH